jgi:division protein CdvB (Snf7/Vps24/ESCRT-III family)
VANENKRKNNLVPISSRGAEEQKEFHRMGGIASGTARRRKRDLKNITKELLSLPNASDQLDEVLARAGVDIEDRDNSTAMMMSMLLAALNGDVQAAKFIRDVIGEDNDTARLKLQQREAKLKFAPSDSGNEKEKSALFNALKDSDTDSDTGGNT